MVRKQCIFFSQIESNMKFNKKKTKKKLNKQNAQKRDY